AFPQAYPARPVTLIVPFAAGGPTDTIARIIAERIGKTMGQPVIVETTAGAGGTMAVARAVRSAPDGYTFIIGHNRPMVIVTAKTRLPSAPDIPTVDEAGLPNFYMAIWHAFWVPKGTPREVVARLNGAIREALVDPAVRKRLEDLGQEIPATDQQSPEALRA